MRRMIRALALCITCALAMFLAVAAATMADGYFIRRNIAGIKSAVADLAACALDTVLGGDCKASAGQYVSSGAPSPSVQCPGHDSSCDGSASDKAGLSCQELFDNGVSSDGARWIKPAGGSAFQIYCDMESGVGGWTLVAGINGADNNHKSTGAVTPGNLTSPAGFGKLSDSQINALAVTEFRVTCNGINAWFPGTCNFQAGTEASGLCEQGTATHGNQYDGGSGTFGVTGLEHLKPGGFGMVYGSNPGCGQHNVGGGMSGVLYVR